MNQLDRFINKFSKYSDPYLFYNGQVELLFDKDKHEYLRVEGENLIVVPSVTQILKKTLDKSEVLINWGCKMMGAKLISLVPKFPLTISQIDLEALINHSKGAHKEKLDEAGNIGTLAHNWIEAYIKQQLGLRETVPPLPDNEQSKSCCLAALDWMKNHNIRWLKTEQKIYSQIHGYAGTMDGLALVDSCNDIWCCSEAFKDRLSITDWKTGNSLYIEMLLQTAAYENAYVEETGEPVVDRWIIRLGKDDGEFQAWHADVDTFDGDLFGFLNALRLYKSLELIEERMKSKTDMIKNGYKAEAKLKQQEQYKIKCKSADKYKGKRKPVCNNGNPCEHCLAKYEANGGKIDDYLSIYNFKDNLTN